MRSFAIVAFGALTMVPASAADLSVPSRVDAVTVFLSGAEVTRIAKVKVDKGEHVVTIVDIPAGAVAGSIRVEGTATGKLDIASVDTRRTYLTRADAQAADAERKALEDQIEALRDEKAAYDAQITAAETQRALIANLAQLPTRPAPGTGTAGGEDWSRVLTIIGQGSGDAVRALVDAQVKARELERRIVDLENKLSLLAPAKSEQTEVKVYVTAASPLEADLTVRYQVAAASWTPLYDARLTSGSKTEPAALELARRAAITQRSGETWENAALKLSTARPSAGASAPELSIQTVDFEPELKPVPVAKVRRMDAQRKTARDEDGVSGEMADMAVAAAAPPAEAMVPEPVAVTQVASTVATAPFEATYAVAGRVSVPGTGEAKRVMLSAEKLEPKLSCRTVPKLDPQAYLYAKLTVGKSTPILPGQVYLFRDGTFVGTGRMPLLAGGEEHDLGFGVDDQVKVRHAIVEETRGETGLISSSRTDVRNYRVTVKNMHERQIDLVVIDQIPVSRNQEIKVEYTGKAQPSKTDIDDKRGVMSFEGKLEPDEEKVLEYGYRIAWPGAKSIVYGQ